MGFQDKVFLSSRAYFCTTHLSNCGRGEGVMTTTCLGTLDRGKQEHAPCKMI